MSSNLKNPAPNKSNKVTFEKGRYIQLVDKFGRPIEKPKFETGNTQQINNVSNNGTHKQPISQKQYAKRALVEAENGLTQFNSDKTVINTKLNPKTKTFVPNLVKDNITDNLPRLEIEDITVAYINSLSDSGIVNLVENILLKRGKMFSKSERGTRMNAKSLEKLTERYNKVMSEYSNNSKAVKMLSELSDKEPDNYLNDRLIKGMNKGIKEKKLATRASLTPCYLIPQINGKANLAKWAIVSGTRTLFLSDEGKARFLKGETVPAQRAKSQPYSLANMGDVKIYPARVFDNIQAKAESVERKRNETLARLMNENHLTESEAKRHEDYLAVK